MSKTRTVMIGCGGMARHHIRNMLKMQATTTISHVCEPSAQAYEETAALFDEAGVPVPPNQPDLAKLLSDQRGQIVVHHIANRRVQAARPGGFTDDVPKPHTMAQQRRQSILVGVRRQILADHLAHQPPEGVAGVGVVATGRQRGLARQAAQHQQPGVGRDDRREAALTRWPVPRTPGRRSCRRA